MFTTLIILMSFIVLAFIAVWLFRPGLRTWMEQPKYRMLEQERRFDLPSDSR